MRGCTIARPAHAVRTLFFLLAGLLLLPEASGAQVPTFPTPRFERLVVPTTTTARTLVALAPNGDGWVTARGTTFEAVGIPEEMRNKLNEFTGDGHAVDAVAFTPEGGWTVVAGSANWTRNVGGDYYDTVRDLTRQGRRIRCVAFNPDDWKRKRGFVIVHEGGFTAREVPDELRGKLAEFVRDNRRIDAVAFTPDGGWTIVADGASWTRNVGGSNSQRRVDYFDRITDLSGDRRTRIHDVAFVPQAYDANKGYVIVSSATFEAQDAPPDLVLTLEHVFGMSGTVRGGAIEEEPAATAAFTAPTRTAEIDLRTLRVNRPTERADDPYLVIYTLRGRLHDRNRIFIHEMKMWKEDPEGHILFSQVPGGENTARAGRTLDLTRAYSRVVFEDLRPFEVYGVLVVLADEDRTGYDAQQSAYERLSRAVVDQFDRAVPPTGRTLDYGLLTRDNVRDIVETSLSGLRDGFDRSFIGRFAGRLRSELGGGDADDIIGIQPIFFINAPEPENDEAQEALNLAEHLAPPDCVLDPGSFRIYFREDRSGDLTGERGVYVIPDDHTYVLEGTHRLFR